MRGVKRALDFIEEAIGAVISALLALMVAVIFYQVVMRYGFHSANSWAEEFARYAFIWVVMLGCANAVRRYKHIRIDFIVERLPPGAKRATDLFSHAVMFSFLFFLFVEGVKITMQTGNQISAGLHVPMSFMYMSIPIGAFLMMLFILESLCGAYRAKDAEKLRKAGD